MDNAPRWDGLIVNTHLATLQGEAGYGIVEDGALGWKDGRLVFAGPRADLPAAPEALAAEVLDAGGRWITPGLVDCHTHLVFGGDRAGEFEQRLRGASYEDIARAGGGIVSTVRATRAADEDALLAQSLPRARALRADGVTTVEIKSGYGLDFDDERRMLRVARRIGEALGVTVRTTFLGAHALPPEYAGKPQGSQDYIDLVCNEMLPQLAAEGLVDAVDAFCEHIGFTPAQTRRVFETARTLGLPVKLHAEQLSNLHGAALAAEFGALSADHLEHVDMAGVAAMAKAGVVATLLPGAYYFVRETKLPPIENLRGAGVPMAVATDCNPGTSPLTSLLLTMNMGATLFRLTVDECLAGVTREAARALGMLAQTGTLEVGKRCDLAIWDIERPAELIYRMGFNPLHARVWSGK